MPLPPNRLCPFQSRFDYPKSHCANLFLSGILGAQRGAGLSCSYGVSGGCCDEACCKVVVDWETLSWWCGLGGRFCQFAGQTGLRKWCPFGQIHHVNCCQGCRFCAQPTFTQTYWFETCADGCFHLFGRKVAFGADQYQGWGLFVQ